MDIFTDGEGMSCSKNDLGLEWFKKENGIDGTPPAIGNVSRSNNRKKYRYML